MLADLGAPLLGGGGAANPMNPMVGASDLPTMGMFLGAPLRAHDAAVEPLAAPAPISLGTSNIGKYRVGQLVSNMGRAGQVSGIISAIIPSIAGATSGPGQIVVASSPPQPYPVPPSVSPDPQRKGSAPPHAGSGAGSGG